MTRTPRAGRSRPVALKRLVAGTFEDTGRIVEAVVKESTRALAWRPVRATAAMAMAGEDQRGVHIWMTTAEFATWLERFFPRQKRKPLGHMSELVGIPNGRRRTILEGARITKVEALACAHFAAGLPLPIPVGDVDAFAAWVELRFGAVRAISLTLEIAEPYIPERLRGYATTSNGRAQRLPDVTIIRALDWVWRVGPFSPYGRRLPGPAFPGQSLEVFTCGS